MLRRNRSILSLFLVAALAAALGLLYSCDKSTSTPEPQGDLSGSARIEPDVGGSAMLGAVTDTVAPYGRIEVWAANIAFDPETGMVTFDVKLVNLTRRTLTPAIRFVITEIRPPDVAVVDFDGTTPDGFPFYDFSDMLGDDRVLSPGESTGPVTMKFHTVEARAFSIGFRLEFGLGLREGVIAGVVFRDDNKNGILDRCDGCEPGIPGITVVLQLPCDRDDGDDDGDDPGDSTVTEPYPGYTLIARTDENGRYRFEGLGEGAYKVFVVVSPERWEITSANPLLVMLVKGPDGKVQSFLEGHFGLFPLVAPPPGDNLFGPILVGPHSRVGVLLDSTFVNPPSPLTVVYHYYVDVALPVIEGPWPVIVDTAAAWINDELVFEYRRAPSDTMGILPMRIPVRDGLVNVGENAIRIYTDGNEYAAALWRVFRQP